MKRTEGEESAYRIFEREFEDLKREVGEDAAARALLVFSRALFWLRTFGHGNLILSAVNHSFGLKIRADTVFSVKDS